MHASRFMSTIVAAAVVGALPLSARISPHETISRVIDGNRVTIIYGRPYTKAPKPPHEMRKIWGGLVPYGRVWRTGADEATTLITQKAIMLGGKEVPAGVYTVFTIPEPDGGKLIINKQVGQWGLQYDEKEDFARVDLKRESLAPPLHQFTMAIDKNPAGGGLLKLMWESAQYVVPFTVAKPTARGPRIEFPAPSPTGTVKQRVGLTDISVVYSRPGMKGRVIFGGLVPYDEVWRAGANAATRISFSTPVNFGGTEVPAGTYGLFAIPGREEWTVILNKVANQWGAYQYNPKEDVVRVTAKPEELATPVETFTIGINDIRDQSATLNLTWDRVRVPVKLGFDVVSMLEPKIEAVMASDASRKPYAQAAMFYGDHGVHLKEAVAWMDKAIAGVKTEGFYLWYHKAVILAKMGDKAGAEAAARQSIALAEKLKGPEKEEYIRLNETLMKHLQ